MKTTIYELLGMIKDDNIPQRIIFKDQIYEYVESAEDYYNEEHGYIFDVYVLKSILNDEVEILETTLNTKNMNITTNKIEKLDIENDGNTITLYNNNEWSILDNVDIIYGNKINEIINYINKENKSDR